MSDTKGNEPFWAIVELMGHVRVAGKVSEEERFGAKMGRLEVPQSDGSFVTQFFGGGSVYRISPVAEEVARKVALNSNVAPVSAWELAEPRPVAAVPQLTADRTMPCGHTPEDCDCDPDDDFEPDDENW